MKGFDEPVHVTRPYLPPLSTFASRLDEIWRSRQLTNGGPIVRRLERHLAQYMGVNRLALCTNGALALQIALQALDVKGDVITTPFTFVASVNAIVQRGLRPVFADVREDDLTIDPDSVEALISPNTGAILAVHVFGTPCAHDRLAGIARRHGIPLIYDAAHAFGVSIGGASIAAWGDATMFSFHATKLFHTVEGGAIAFGDDAMCARANVLSNHGLEPDGDVADAGTNAKMSEIQALMGELMLEHVAEAVAHGGAIEAIYRDRLRNVPGIHPLPPPRPGVTANHSFMPVLVDRDVYGRTPGDLQAWLRDYNVNTRRYFSPLICDMTAFGNGRVRDALPVARRLGQRTLALPTYADLPLDAVHRICDLIEHARQTAMAANAASGD